MNREIKRNNWSRFCKSFSKSNQYRSAKVVQKQRGKAEEQLCGSFPLMGLKLTKSGRFIDGIEFYGSRAETDTAAEAVVGIKDPKRIVLSADASGIHQTLQIETKSGAKVKVAMEGPQHGEMQQKIVEQIAHTLYETRGAGHGDDQQDWYTAQRIVEETESKFTK